MHNNFISERKRFYKKAGIEEAEGNKILYMQINFQQIHLFSPKYVGEVRGGVSKNVTN